MRRSMIVWPAPSEATPVAARPLPECKRGLLCKFASQHSASHCSLGSESVGLLRKSI